MVTVTYDLSKRIGEGIESRINKLFEERKPKEVPGLKGLNKETLIKIIALQKDALQKIKLIV